MTVPQSMDAYSNHLQSLTSQWVNLLEAQSFSNTKYFELYERSKTVLCRLCANAQEFFEQLDKSPSTANIEQLIGKLRATQLDLNNGFLHLEHQIQDRVSIDLMEQAEQLLSEDSPGDEGNETHEHIPAAVLAGAVLEHFLRTLCSRQSPPIAVHLDNGNHKTLARLIDDLEKAELYNEVEKQQLKVWVKIRNAAAHGQFDQFSREQVEDMIDDIKHFIEEHK